MGNSSSQPSASENANQNSAASLGGKGMSKEEVQRLAVSALSEVPSECPMHGGPPPGSGCPIQHDGPNNTQDVDPLNMVRAVICILHGPGLYKTCLQGFQQSVCETQISHLSYRV